MPMQTSNAFPVARSVAICAVVMTLVTSASAQVASAQAYKLIVNDANHASGISSSEVAQIFMKKKTDWPSGEAVIPVDQSANSPSRVAFSKDVLHRDVMAMKLYWQQQMFAGRANAPDEKASDAVVVAYIKDNPGAIGYVSSAASTTGVKVLVIHE
ncbi:MAG: hypothetical protein ABJB66_02425 [Gemmatimonadaceae bacterium]